MCDSREDCDISSARQQHLAFVQAALTRMATTSSMAKGWCLTLVTAALSYSLVNRSWPVTALACGAVGLFASLDARYLREERKYRGLYNAARRSEAALYDMDASTYGDPKSENYCENCDWWSVLTSWSIWWFYLPALSASILVMARIACQG
jgi:hypothetical protein